MVVAGPISVWPLAGIGTLFDGYLGSNNVHRQFPTPTRKKSGAKVAAFVSL